MTTVHTDDIEDATTDIVEERQAARMATKEGAMLVLFRDYSCSQCGATDAVRTKYEQGQQRQAEEGVDDTSLKRGVIDW